MSPMFVFFILGLACSVLAPAFFYHPRRAWWHTPLSFVLAVLALVLTPLGLPDTLFLSCGSWKDPLSFVVGGAIPLFFMFFNRIFRPLIYILLSD